MYEPVRFSRQIASTASVPSPKYVGPGDIVSGAFAWWGLRAYSFATMGNNAVRLRRDSDNSEQNFTSLSPYGHLDVASIATFGSGANLFVATLYDQSGNGRDLTQATAGVQPQLVLSGLGSLPVMSMAILENRQVGHSSLSLSQPYVVSAVSNITDDAGGQAVYWASDTAPIWMAGVSGTSAWRALTASGGSVIDITVGTYTDVWRAALCVFSGGLSVFNVNGTESGPGTLGTNAIAGAFHFGGVATNSAWDFTESGIWSGRFISAKRTKMINNQRGYWGF